MQLASGVARLQVSAITLLQYLLVSQHPQWGPRNWSERYQQAFGLVQAVWTCC
jgi:hypothetical protein